MSKLFLSCVTREFGAYRTLLTKDLRRAGVDVRVQEDFGVAGSTLLDALDAYIRQCDAVIHLIGHGTGAFPETPAVRALLERYPDILEKIPGLLDASISYTQWEAYLSIYHAREIHIYRASETAARGTDFIATEEERRSQEQHFKRIEALGWQRGTFESPERLTAYVLGDLRHILEREAEELLAAPTKLPKKHDTGVFEGREKVLADLDARWNDTLTNKPGRAKIISLVAIGGAGKTTVASRWKDALLAREDHGGVERYFDWSFYSQGTRREGDNASAQTAADATVFIAAALKFFGDPVMADSAAPAWDKGARLATLVAKHRTLLILDGLEPLQHPPGPQKGELKDDALRALFAGLQNTARGLCLVTTRESITDLAATQEGITPEWQLDRLTDVAGALVLKRHGVSGPNDELRRASAEVKGHALTLSLMGRYLTLAFDPPDIARRDCFRFSEADAEALNGHAFRVFATYESWFKNDRRHVENAILRLLGLFDRPATPDCIAALCDAPVIPGLTEPLIGLGQRQWNTAIQRLRELGLIETAMWIPFQVSGFGEKEANAEMEAGQEGKSTNIGSPQPFTLHRSLVLQSSIDAHPLLREYFNVQLKEHGSAPAAHARIYEHLRNSVPFWPEGREGLLPLYQAVAHGCKAGRVEASVEQVYIARILRGTAGNHAFYSRKKLGLHALNLSAQACFFVEPWQRVDTNLSSELQSWVFNEAALGLRALNRLREAQQSLRAAMELDVQLEDWSNAAIGATTLSEVELMLGDVTAAVETATKCVYFADRSAVSARRTTALCTQADALHQANRRQMSFDLFVEAEAMQADLQPYYPLLYSLRGYQYCDLLLADAERSAWRKDPPERADRATLLSDVGRIKRRLDTISAWTPRDRILDFALNQLSFGRTYLLSGILQHSTPEISRAEFLHAREVLVIAIATLRQANSSHHIPRALLPCAWLHALAGEWDTASQRLDESFALATRGGNAQNNWLGGMRLHLIDTLLHRARLFGRLNNESNRMPGIPQPPEEYPWPGRTARMDLDEAAALIEICGYHRRDEELADAMAAID